MAITSRQLRDEDDYQSVRVMVQRIYAVEGPPSYCTVGDLDWWRYTGEDPAAIWKARIWLDAGGTVVAFAWPDKGRLDHFSLPDYHDLEPEMVAWAAEQIRADDSQTSMTALAYDGHSWRKEYLQQLGFTQSADADRYWHRVLTDLPESQPLGGYSIRNVRGESDVAARVAAHRDAFAPSKMTEAKHLAVMTSPTYRADLDLIVEAPDGTVAAYCTVWFDEANANGVFEPVGCHSAYRRRGLTKAVLFEGMRRLQKLGATTACVASYPDDVAGNRLYESVGFEKLAMNLEWVKSLT